MLGENHEIDQSKINFNYRIFYKEDMLAHIIVYTMYFVLVFYKQVGFLINRFLDSRNGGYIFVAWNVDGRSR